MPISFEVDSMQDEGVAQSMQLPGNQAENTKIPFRCEIILVLSGVPASRSQTNRKIAYCIGISAVCWHIFRNFDKFHEWSWKDLIHPSWESRTPISIICKLLHGIFALSVTWQVRDALRLDPKSYRVLHQFSSVLLGGWLLLRVFEFSYEFIQHDKKWWELVGVFCPGFFHEVPRAATVSLFALACETLFTRKRQFLTAVAACTTSADVNTYYQRFEQQVLEVSGRFKLFLAVALILEFFYLVSLLLMKPGSHRESMHIYFVMFKVVMTAVLFLSPAAMYNTSILFAAEKFATRCMQQNCLVEGPNLTACALLMAKPAYFRIAYVWNVTLPKLALFPVTVLITRFIIPAIVQYVKDTNMETITTTTTITSSMAAILD